MALFSHDFLLGFGFPYPRLYQRGSVLVNPKELYALKIFLSSRRRGIVVVRPRCATRSILYEASWIDILAFGIGFGAFEAFALGAVALSQIGQYILRPEAIPEKYRREEDWKISLSNFSMLLVGPVERVSALCVHVFSNVIIILAVQQNIYLLFWLSFGFKTLVDGIAGWMTLEKDIENSTKVSQWWAYQSVFMTLALISVAGIVLLQKIWYS
ncbi:MAG: hypothetical protein DDT29_02127 [Dehalococcoidia bacterium]|nr:hypothetical protein [Bacillota bacterium]